MTHADPSHVVDPYPVDAGLPSLAAAIAPDEIGPLLVALGLAEPTLLSPPAACLTVDVLRYRPRTRCVLCYTLHDPATATPRELIGKVYRSPKRAIRAWRAHTALFAQASSATVRFPKPLAVVEDRCLVLMEKVAGESMRDRLLADSGPLAEQLVVLAASTLANLHQLELKLDSDRSPSIDMEIAAVRRQIERLEPVAPDLAWRAARLVRQISVVAASCDSETSRPLHGDYTPSQLILGTGPLTIVDFDRVGFGDPAVDVGTFMAKLLRDAELSDRDHLRRLPTKFLDTYVAGHTHGIAERAVVMQSLVLIRIALSRVRLDPTAGSRCTPQMASAGDMASSHDAFDHLLEEAAACLAAR